MVAGEDTHCDFLPMQHSTLHGVDQILVYRCMYEFLSTCTMSYICNRHTFCSDMYEKVHKVISIKDVLLDVIRVNISITLDNDRQHK